MTCIQLLESKWPFLKVFSASCDRMEFIENPFTVNGELSQKADYIITHSTITRREILIADPDCIPIELPQNPVTQQEPPENISSRETEEKPINPDHEEDVVVVKIAPSTECSPVVAENNVSSQNPHSSVAKPETVEAEVKKVDTAEPQHAEEVKLKTKKRCCSVL